MRLIAENIRGKSAPSEPTRQFETRSTEPENPPEKLYAEPLSSERIQLVWSPLNIHQWNAEPIGYLVMYRPARAKRLGNMKQLMGEEEEESNEDWVSFSEFFYLSEKNFRKKSAPQIQNQVN